MDESIQKALLRCVFRVFTISHDPVSHTQNLFHVALAKLSEGSSSPTFGGCDQPLLAPRSKIARRCGIALRRGVRLITSSEPLSIEAYRFEVPSILFSFHPLAAVRRTVLESHPIASLAAAMFIAEGNVSLDD
jgi:hypothetical protein